MLTPIKAIRAKCLDCCCGSFKEVKQCPIEDCALYPYRFGHRPKSNLSTETPAKERENPQTAPWGSRDIPRDENGTGGQFIPAFSEKEATPCPHTL